MSKITVVEGTGVPIKGNDIDTDRMIPARFLKEITFERMGQYLFYDVRFHEDGSLKDHPLNDLQFQNPSFMFVERNFGCGSSREHAPQAIMRFGIKAIIGESFGEIFSGNCKMIGIPTVTISQEDLHTIMAHVNAFPNERFKLALDKRTLAFGDEVFYVGLPDDRQNAFLNGTWKMTSLLKKNAKSVQETASRLPYMRHFS
ncbi:MAG: 3-isopropylmalate dehydratase small subunit [Candidatus Margulisbacteria bacterium]|nr:3-isopropylmalate dehydratase small subunit [Candidatus Margulisiibacteriota bacterium]